MAWNYLMQHLFQRVGRNIECLFCSMRPSWPGAKIPCQGGRKNVFSRAHIGLSEKNAAKYAAKKKAMESG